LLLIDDSTPNTTQLVKHYNNKNTKSFYFPLCMAINKIFKK